MREPEAAAALRGLERAGWRVGPPVEPLRIQELASGGQEAAHLAEPPDAGPPASRPAPPGRTAQALALTGTALAAGATAAAVPRGLRR
ncbi:hypothetical protein [Streptomyces sp. NPDC057877]|uniref:hypothetical protein n=1 Tax=Streptomyces sp. NPDC057877 TaxID=3346269 RepID=UPI0036D1850F